MKILYAAYESGIDDHGIKDLLQLEELYVISNEKITNINHLTKLKILCASYESGINDHGIKDLLELEKLYVSSNKCGFTPGTPKEASNNQY